MTDAGNLLRMSLDIVAIVSAFLAAWFWFRASRKHLRRVSRSELIDSADLNRVVVTINRTQILNAQAALATAVSAAAVALRLLIDLIAP